MSVNDQTVTPVKSSSSTGCGEDNSGIECCRGNNERSVFDRIPSDCCSVCLSPIKSVFSHCDLESVVVKTKCQHYFHEACLTAAKQFKSECPMCRMQLTPLSSDAILSNTIVPTAPLLDPLANSTNLRSAVIDAASRARNAVRLAMERREQQVAQLAFQRSLNELGPIPA